jgi:microcystin-dependent protein
MATTKLHTFAGNIGIGTTDPGAFRLNVVGMADTTSLEINGVTNAEVKIGLIGLWYGTIASIPSGWALCNGQTVVRTDDGQDIVTPNLVDRIVRCADGDAPSPAVPGQTSGSNALTLTADQMPSHSHVITVDDGNANHAHGGDATNSPHNHGVAGAGSNHAHNIQGANAPHSHYIVIRSGDHPQATDNFVWAGASKRDIATWGGNTGNSSSINHGHNVDQAGGDHTHAGNTSNAPHSHNVNAANAPHTHTANSSETGGGSSINIQNKYIYLAYIMKH